MRFSSNEERHLGPQIWSNNLLSHNLRAHQVGPHQECLQPFTGALLLVTIFSSHCAEPRQHPRRRQRRIVAEEPLLCEPQRQPQPGSDPRQPGDPVVSYLDLTPGNVGLTRQESVLKHVFVIVEPDPREGVIIKRVSLSRVSIKHGPHKRVSVSRADIKTCPVIDLERRICE